MLKIIGAGFGRTGTLSLRGALEFLGFTKCYHMMETLANPEHLFVWEKFRLARRQGKFIDWETLLQGYQATLDWPACFFYKELMQHYPEAKVILSIRDPEKWYVSTLQTIYNAHRNVSPNFPDKATRGFRYFVAMVENIIWKGTFHGKFEDKAYALEVFNRHIEEVKQTVPAERLLVYEVKEGWEPLGRFLNVPVPHNQPFPHHNASAEFENLIKQKFSPTTFEPALS